MDGEHNVRPLSKRCPTVYYDSSFSFLYYVQQSVKGEKEGDVLGTSGQWVAPSGHYLFLQLQATSKVVVIVGWINVYL